MFGCDESVREGLMCPEGRSIVFRLRNDGYNAWLVGKDDSEVFATEVKCDLEIVTDAPVERVRLLFPECDKRERALALIWSKRGDKFDVTRIRRIHSVGLTALEHYRRDQARRLGHSKQRDGGGSTSRRPPKSVGKTFQRDPAKMLAALTLASQRRLPVPPETSKLIRLHRNLLAQVDVFDELMRLFTHGDPKSVYPLLRDHNLMDVLFPQYVSEFSNYHVSLETWFCAVLQAADHLKAHQADQIVFIFAALLWPIAMQSQRQTNWGSSSTFRADLDSDSDYFRQLTKGTGLPLKHRRSLSSVWRQQILPIDQTDGKFLLEAAQLRTLCRNMRLR